MIVLHVREHATRGDTVAVDVMVAGIRHRTITMTWTELRDQTFIDDILDRVETIARQPAEDVLATLISRARARGVEVTRG